EAVNIFMGLPGDDDRLELTYNFEVPEGGYQLGTGYGHIAVTVDDLDGALAELAGQGIEPERAPYTVREGGPRLAVAARPGAHRAGQDMEPERAPYTVREGGPRLAFVADPDGYRVELIERGL